ncbi:MAG: hypothetical protein IPP57_17125 [Candidatus Obscuribacter sp.]|nr:hypothetical protein [Candidatus Obscuribacter sp.]
MVKGQHDGHSHGAEGHESASAVNAQGKSVIDLRTFEEDLNKREIGLIEREIKSLRLQEELDRLRPLSGLYRVVKAMATERKLDSLLDTITRETQAIVKCDRCSVFVLDQDKGELWTQVAQGLVGVHHSFASIQYSHCQSLCSFWQNHQYPRRLSRPAF